MPQIKQSTAVIGTIAGVLAIAIVAIAFNSFVVVDPGHVAVSALFGKVNPDAYVEGMHFPVNPLRKFHFYDARQKTHKESAGVPSQDQLTTQIDVSVQYRVSAEMAPVILQTTGNVEQLLEVQLVPKLRSVLREQGKTVEKAEHFFREDTQQRLQDSLLTELEAFCAPKGIVVEAVLIRDIQLPQFITKAIEAKKEREQEVEKQKAELERFKTEQEQLVAQASAERQAAEEEAAKLRVLADARAYEINAINEAMTDSPAYIQLQALETLREMSMNPATQLYFLSADAPMPLPLMNVGSAVSQ